MKKALLLLLITIIGFSSSKASHIIGGDITYECLGNNDYKVILTLYRDCSGITLGNDDQIEISSSCQAAQFVNVTGIDLSPNDPSTNGMIDTNYLCSDILNQNLTTCGNGNYPGVMIHRYEAIVNLAACPDWTFRWASCCRNPAYEYPAPNACGQAHEDAITRVTNPASLGTALIATMDNSDGTCNSSPNFFTTPRAFVCQGQEIFLDNGGIDPDGDSLVYELVSPIDNGNNPLPYEFGYSFQNPISLVPGTNFLLNANNGQLSFYPQNYGVTCNNNDSLEQSSFAVRASQFRNGVLVGTTVRDIQLVTLPGCDPLDPVNLGIQTVSLPSSFINDSTARLCAGDSLEFSIRITDFANLDSFSLESNLEQQLPTSSEFTITYADSIGNDVFGNFLIKPTNEDGGTYNFSVTAENDGCPVEISRVFNFTLEVISRTLIEVDYDTTCVGQQDTVLLSASGGDNFVWSILDVTDSTWTACDTCPETQAFPPRTVDYVVSSDLNLINPTSCPDKDTMTITRVQPPFPLADICYYDTLFVVWNGWEPTENVVYIWNDDENLDDDNIFITEDQDTYFYFAQDTVDFSDSIVCEWRDTNTVTACPVSVPNIFTPNNDTYNDVFFIDNIQSEIWNLQIYNRWGKNLIKDFRDYQNDWDGEGLKDGTYYYRLYSQQGAEIVEYKGWVVIAR